MTEQSCQGLFEAASEKHGGPNVFLLPAIEIAMPVAARAGQVLRNLGVAVIHRAALPFCVPLLLTAALADTPGYSLSKGVAAAVQKLSAEEKAALLKMLS